MSIEFDILTYSGGPVVQRSLSVNQVVERIRLGRGHSLSPGPAKVYSQIAAVYAAVRAKADALASMPLMVSTGDDEIVETGPLVRLSACPNPKMTGRACFRATSAFLDLFGRCHWVKNTDAAGRALEVFVINPLQMQAVVNRTTGELTGWRFRAAGTMRGREQILPVEDVHTIIDPDFEDPDHPWEGLGARRAAARAISQYWKADLANEASLDNGVEPGGVFTMPGTPTDPQIADMREMMDDRHTGVLNRRRFMLLYGGADFKATQSMFKDMEFAGLKGMSREDICAAFSVPPSVVGFFKDSNYAHAEAAQKQFWINTNLPRAAWIAEEWTIGILAGFNGDRSLGIADARRDSLRTRQQKAYGFTRARDTARRTAQRFFAWFDSSVIPAVQAALLDQAEMAKAWLDKGVPLNQVIKAFDLPFAEQPWGDTWYKPIGLADVREDTLPGAEDPDGTPGDQEQAEDRDVAVRAHGPLAIDQKTEQTLNRLWEQWRASWSGLERSARSRIKRHFSSLRAETLARLAEAVPEPGARSVTPDRVHDLIGLILFDIVSANETLIARVGPLLRESARLGGSQSMQEAADAQGKEEPNLFRIDDPEVQSRLRRRQIRLANTNRTTQRRLAKSLAEGLANNETQTQLADRVRQQFKIASNRAATIARTEVGAAVEEARHEGRRQSGTPLKSWLWSRRETGRPWHRDTERLTLDNPVPNAENFVIAQTGNTAAHPRGSGSPEDDINCGCTAIARFPGDTVRSVLDRYRSRGFLTYEQLCKRDPLINTQGTEAKPCDIQNPTR